MVAYTWGFHVGTTRHLTGMWPWMVKRKWVYPLSVDVLKAAGLYTVDECIAKQKANIAKTIEGRRVLEEYRGATRW